MPFVQGFDSNGISTLAVGYSIPFGGLAIPESDAYLEFYKLQEGRWRLATAAPIDKAFEGSSFFVAPVLPSAPGQQWFVAWRQLFGDTGARRKVRLFAFDGKEAKCLWRRNELTDGEVTVLADHIRFSYAEQYQSRTRVYETFTVTPTGLRLLRRCKIFE